jgi:hypothetical protein
MEGGDIQRADFIRIALQMRIYYMVLSRKNVADALRSHYNMSLNRRHFVKYIS